MTTLVVIVIPAHNGYNPIIAYLGVVPAHRGHRYIHDVLAAGTSMLAAVAWVAGGAAGSRDTR